MLIIHQKNIISTYTEEKEMFSKVQKMIQKEIEKRARFEEIDKNLKSSSSGLENFNIVLS